MHIGLLGEAFFSACVAMVELQGHWGERFGGVVVFWGGCCVGSCSAAGPLGTALWRCILDGFWQRRSCITIMGPKVDEVGPKMAPTQP